MNPFDDLTLAEVEELRATCLGGQPIADSDPIQLAGGVMFLTQRRTQPDITWLDFKNTTRMGAIKEFSDLMQNEDENPTNGVSH